VLECKTGVAYHLTLLRLARGVLEVEADGELEVQLDGGTLHARKHRLSTAPSSLSTDLVLAAQGVRHLDVDLGPVEGAVSRVEGPGVAGAVQGRF